MRASSDESAMHQRLLSGDPVARSGATRRASNPSVVAGALASAGKKAADEGRTVVWVDQSGFYLLPLAVRTWAPCGQTPHLTMPLTHDHLSAINGITADGRLFMQTQKDAYRSPDVVRFLRLLLRKIHGKLLVIWDGSPIHRGQPVKDFLARGAARRLHLERLSGYAPELNPDEGIWNYLKRVELANLCCQDLVAGRAGSGAASRQRAAAPQAHGHPGVLPTSQLPCLAFHAKIRSRAAENQRFVIGSNTAHSLQHCPAMIISPHGEVLAEAHNAEAVAMIRSVLDVSETSNWYLSQCRTDIVAP